MVSESQLFQVVYISSATRSFTRDDLDKIVEASRTRNEADAITGILIFHDGNFLQVLEGTSSVLCGAMARIESDARHRNVITLLKKPICEREFGQWCMQLISPQASFTQQPTGPTSQARVLMRSFALNAR